MPVQTKIDFNKKCHNFCSCLHFVKLFKCTRDEGDVPQRSPNKYSISQKYEDNPLN